MKKFIPILLLAVTMTGCNKPDNSDTIYDTPTPAYTGTIIGDYPAQYGIDVVSSEVCTDRGNVHKYVSDSEYQLPTNNSLVFVTLTLYPVNDGYSVNVIPEQFRLYCDGKFYTGVSDIEMNFSTKSTVSDAVTTITIPFLVDKRVDESMVMTLYNGDISFDL